MPMSIQEYNEDTVLIEDGKQQVFVTGAIISFKAVKDAIVCGYCNKPTITLRGGLDGYELECPHCNRRSATLQAGIRIT